MSDSDDPHLELLRNMWNEMKTLDSRVKTTNERLASFERATTERLDATNERLDIEHLEKHTGLR